MNKSLNLLAVYKLLQVILKTSTLLPEKSLRFDPYVENLGLRKTKVACPVPKYIEVSPKVVGTVVWTFTSSVAKDN